MQEQALQPEYLLALGKATGHVKFNVIYRAFR